jgi:hypothetical protein
MVIDMLSKGLEKTRSVLVRLFLQLQDQLGAGGCTYFPLLSRKILMRISLLYLLLYSFFSN